MKPKPPKKFEWRKSLAKTYTYYAAVLVLTIIISVSTKNDILKFAWIYGAIRFGYLVYLTFAFFISIGLLATRVNILSGPPGCGKTFIMTVLAVLHTKTYWIKYQIANFLYERHGDTVKWRSKLKKGASVNPNKASQIISLFDSARELTRLKRLPIISNIEITYKGYKSYPLELDYLMLLKRIPEGFIICVDEIGQMLAAQGYKETPKEIKELFRLNRHFFDGYILATEQDHNNIDISVRRVVGQNFRLEKAKHVGRAYGLEIFNKLNLIFKAVRLLIAEKLYGFRKIEYHIEANTEATQNVRIINSTDNEQKTYFYIPACYSYYDDREMFNKQFEKKSKRIG